jgi:hypothetical protein
MEDVFKAAAVNPRYRLDFEDFLQTPEGTKLYRVIALRSFGSDAEFVEKGQVGGFIECEHKTSRIQAIGVARAQKGARRTKRVYV